MREQPLHQELVPLNEATAVAHHVLFDRSRARRSLEELAVARNDIAMTLAAISRIFVREGERLRLLPMAEFQSLVGSPRGAAARDLSALYIWRCDLLRAIEAIKQLQPRPLSQHQTAGQR